MRRLLLGLGALGLAAVAFAGLQAYRAARSGADALTRAIASAQRGDRAAALAHFVSAQQGFDRSHGWLGAWWVAPIRRLPLVDGEVHRVRTLIDAGTDLAAVGNRVVRTDFDRLSVAPGALDTAGLARLEGPLTEALADLRRVQRRLSTTRPPRLLQLVHADLAGIDRRVDGVVADVETAALGARAIPALLGADRTRRYFLAIQTPAEQRSSGGIVGSFGQLSATAGRFTLERLGRSRDLNGAGNPTTRQLAAPPDYAARYARFQPERVWQNVTMSPDFPSVGRVVSALYPQSGGVSIDGVVSVDPEALAALLKLTGPVQVRDWPEPLTAANAADVLLRQQYVRFDETERVGFLASTAEAVFQRLTSVPLPGPLALSRALGTAVRGRHLLLFSNHPLEQRFFERAGVAGSMPAVRGDFLAVLVQDASGTKVDAYLHQAVRYRARYEPGTGRLEAEAAIRLENRAPSSGLPPIVIGGAGQGPTAAGENRVYVSVYSPLAFTGGTLDGRPLLMESERELGRNVYSAFVNVPARSAVSMTVRLEGGLQKGSPYRLDAMGQPTVIPAQLRIEVAVRGRSIQVVRGLQTNGSAAWASLEAGPVATFELRLGGRQHGDQALWACSAGGTRPRACARMMA